MSYNRCISPRMLSVYTHFSIRIGNQGERFIKPPLKRERNLFFRETNHWMSNKLVAKMFLWLLCPPVITFSMEEGFGITVKWTGLCGVIILRLVIQRQEEGSWLNGIQGHFVYSMAEIFNPSLSPWNSRRGDDRERRFSIFFFFFYVRVCSVPVCLHTCFLQSGQLIWVLLAGVLIYHWGSFETASQAHWVRGGALQCTATLERIDPCGRQAGAYGQSGAALYLRERVRKKKER